MSVIRCAKGHYYDDNKYPQCPHCAKGTPAVFDTNDVTTARFASSAGIGKTISYDESTDVDSTGKTVSIFQTKGKSNPVAGWLVCIKGENYGRSFEIHIGKNFVGRSMKSDIILNDVKITRENHFSIVYDPVSLQFYILAGDSITYYNGKMLEGSAVLKDDDVISAGDSDYVFVPFCKENRNWSEKK